MTTLLLLSLADAIFAQTILTTYTDGEGNTITSTATITGAVTLPTTSTAETLLSFITPDPETANHNSILSFATDTTTTSTSISSSATGTASNASSSTTDGPVKHNDSGLSTAAKAGIGAGVAVAVILAIALTVLYIRSRRRKYKATNRYVPDADQGDKAGTRMKESSNEASEKTPIVTYPKPELEGSRGTSSFTGSSKPELSATASVARGPRTTPGDALPAAGPRDVLEVDKSRSGKEVTAAERQIPILPQAAEGSGRDNYRNPRVGLPPSPESRSEELSPKFLAGDEGAVRITSREYLGPSASTAGQGPVSGVGQAQEDSPLTIDALKAEHAALAERIRQVEMREQQRQKENDPRTHDPGISTI